MHFNSQKFSVVSKQLCCDFTTLENDPFQVIFFYSCILSICFLFKNIRIHHECDGGIEKSVIVINCNLITFSRVIACNCN